VAEDDGKADKSKLFIRRWLPALPQQNSTESFADEDEKRFLDAIRPLQESAAAGAAAAEREKIRQESLRRNTPHPKDGDRAAVLRAKENPMVNPFLNWTIFGTIKWSITILAVAVIVFIAGVIAESNVRHFLEDRGLDTVLTRVLDVMPAYLAYNATWLGIGLIFGAAAVLWLIWAFPHRLGDHHQLPKSRRIQWMTAMAAVAVIGGAFYLSLKQPQPFTIGVSPIEGPAVSPQNGAPAPAPNPPETGAVSIPVPPFTEEETITGRNFTTLNAYELLELYKGKMGAQGNEIRKELESKSAWLKISGIVIGKYSGGLLVLRSRNNIDTVRCSFSSDKNIQQYPEGSPLQVQGKLAPNQNGTQIYLEKCEIIPNG
jgi:hypothetical protein